MRSRTKGDPILFRLPLHIHLHLVQLAEAEGLTPSHYIAKLVTGHLEGQIMLRPGPSALPEPSGKAWVGKLG